MHIFGGISVNPVENKFCTAALLQSQKDTFAISLLSTGFWGGISVNPVERKFFTVALLQSQKDTFAVSLLSTWFGGGFSVNPVESFVLWHFCRAKKILLQYLCYPHGLGGGSLSILLKVLYCGTFAEPKRYFCSIFAIHMVLGGDLCQSCRKKVLYCGTFAEPKRYLCSIFAMHMVVALLQSHKDTCAVSLHIFAMPLVLGDPCQL